MGGAIVEEDYWQTLRQAGFAEIQIVARHTLTPEELKAMACYCGEEFTRAPAKEDIAFGDVKVDIRFSKLAGSLVCSATF